MEFVYVMIVCAGISSSGNCAFYKEIPKQSWESCRVAAEEFVARVKKSKPVFSGITSCGEVSLKHRNLGVPTSWVFYKS